MSDVKEVLKRMKEAFGAKNLAEVARKLGVSEHTVNNWRQRGEVPEKNLLKCAHLTGKSREWLLYATKNDQNPLTVNEPGIKYGKQQGTYRIPALELKASAGGGNHLESIDSFESYAAINIDRMLFKTEPTENMRAIQVDGYSMAPMLMPDSWVIFELDRGFEGDGLYIINWRNILMVKKIQLDMRSGKLSIISVNPDYDSYDVDPDDQSVFRIVGKVIRSII